MEMGGIEPPTSCLQSRRSPTELHPRASGESRPPESISPTAGVLLDAVGVLGFEPRTSALSELRSSRLSYTPADGTVRKRKKPDSQVWLDPAPAVLVEHHPPVIMALIFSMKTSPRSVYRGL